MKIRKTKKTKQRRMTNNDEDSDGVIENDLLTH